MLGVWGENWEVTVSSDDGEGYLFELCCCYGQLDL